ncbi:hypothetical protein CEK28_04515 [Xenophilus sp. AP218F]|nr:hypothetical protein [Chromobacterium sp. ASV5]OWY40005.1 hypothetical protein CEK28_04515 [Xenophilus sp. AP218F]
MRTLALLLAALALTGCNWIGSVTGLTRDAHKAIGAACRQTGRSLEECYLRNPDADKAAIYAGWREMHEYMAKNKLETLEPPAEDAAASAPMPVAPAKSKPASSLDGGASAAVGKSSANQPAPLSSEEADKAAKTDPQVAAVMAAIRNNKDAPGAAHGGAPGESDQKRLLNIINQLNKQDGKHPPS